MSLQNTLRRTGFTLIEVMVATVIVVILTGILISATDMTAKSFARTSSKIEQFSETRRGFETMTRRLAEATLNTYWGYPDGVDKGTNASNQSYIRKSDLRFISGPMKKIDPTGTIDRPTHGVFFQAPIGEATDRDALGVLSETLNCWGYFLEVDTDTQYIPKILQTVVKPRRRSRLLEFRQPTEENPVYWRPNPTASLATEPMKDRNWWFINSINKTTDRPVRVVAENIIAMVLNPRLARGDEAARETAYGADSDKAALAPDYLYDSTQASNHTPPLTDPADHPEQVNPTNQLPPVIQVVMVALDETSADRLDKLEPTAESFGLEYDKIFEKSVKLADDRGTPDANDGELAKLEAKLIEKRLTYRIFNTDVIIRGAKWSRSQTK